MNVILCTALRMHSAHHLLNVMQRSGGKSRLLSKGELLHSCSSFLAGYHSHTTACRLPPTGETVGRLVCGATVCSRPGRLFHSNVCRRRIRQASGEGPAGAGQLESSRSHCVVGNGGAGREGQRCSRLRPITSVSHLQSALSTCCLLQHARAVAHCTLYAWEDRRGGQPRCWELLRGESRSDRPIAASLPSPAVFDHSGTCPTLAGRVAWFHSARLPPPSPSTCPARSE